jgi:hypothetical protein
MAKSTDPSAVEAYLLRVHREHPPWYPTSAGTKGGSGRSRTPERKNINVSGALQQAKRYSAGRPRAKVAPLVRQLAIQRAGRKAGSKSSDARAHRGRGEPGFGRTGGGEGLLEEHIGWASSLAAG